MTEEKNLFGLNENAASYHDSLSVILAKHVAAGS